MLAGLGGLICGGYALNRARTVTSDSQALADRAAAAGVARTDPRAVRDVAVLHYDALEEMSGARSFSLAMLNSDGDGVVVTSINGRTESRTYAKAITRGDAGTLLSPEEYRVIRSARLGDCVGSGLPAPVPRPTPSGDSAKDGAAEDGDAKDADLKDGDEKDDKRVTVLSGEDDSAEADEADGVEAAGDSDSDPDSDDDAEAKADADDDADDSEEKDVEESVEAQADEGSDESADKDADGPAEEVTDTDDLDDSETDETDTETDTETDDTDSDGERPRVARAGAGRVGGDGASARPRRDRTRDGRPV